MTPLSQAVRERFPRWSGGKSELNQDTLSRLAQDPQLHGQDAAVLAVLKPLVDNLYQLPLPFSLRRAVLTSETLDRYEQLADQGQQKLIKAAESRYQDCLKRIGTCHELFQGAGPEASAVQQGSHGNCVLTATTISLAYQRPQDLVGMLAKDESGYRLKLPGQPSRHLQTPSDWEIVNQSCAYSSGLWMTLLAMRLGDVGQLLHGRAIRQLTGHGTDSDHLNRTSLATTRRKLEEALAAHRVVIAGRSGLAPNEKGLTANHCYAVLKFDPGQDQVLLQDPGGNEPVNELGEARDGQKDGRFTLNLAEFQRQFTLITYER